MKKRHIQKLVVLALALFLILNLPFLLVFNISGAWLGIPFFYWGVFTVWSISIWVSYTILARFYE